MYGLIGFYHYLRKLITILKIGGGVNENKFDKLKHYEIMYKIRNCLELNYEELTFVKTLSKDQLIEIIEINNINIELMNELIRYNEK